MARSNDGEQHGAANPPPAESPLTTTALIPVAGDAVSCVFAGAIVHAHLMRPVR